MKRKSGLDAFTDNVCAVRRGQAHKRALLTDEQAREIYAACMTGACKRELAKQYGVSDRCVWNIWGGRNYSAATTDLRIKRILEQHA